MTGQIDNPVINAPYDPPARHFVIGPHGPTGEIKDGRRPSESFIPIAKAKKGGKPAQQEIDFDLTGERRQRNSLINDLRRDVDLWRQRGYERVTPISRKLLQHWADADRENRVLFCQREAAETVIFLAEVAGRYGYRDWRVTLDDANAEHNSGLPRVALKMATGAGKTVVMAMVIAWHTINKVYNPRDARFAKRFLVVTPGITIRDRLRVLDPGHAQNYYKLRGLIPPELESALHQAQIVITNYHAFLQRDAKEIRGVSATTRKILLNGKEDPFRETPEAMVARVLRDFGTATGKQEIVVLNDEAHHCYQSKPATTTRDQDDANEEAGVWFRGIQAIARRVGLKQVYDLSATPFYLSGSGYNEGYIFPWTVSDFSLMDAIESGIVKVPRTPVDDDAAGDLVVYLRLWESVGDKLPKRKAPDAVGSDGWVIPEVLEGALNSLYRSYQRSFHHWQRQLEPHGETPPVYIVVCPNTLVSKLVYEWIAGTDVPAGEQTKLRPGKLDLFSNVVDGRQLDRPRTILVDSAQLESGDALKGDFKTAAAAEIEAFKSQYRLVNPSADTGKLTDEELLREVLNTVGKPGMLGAGVRCVVSVAMLSEGWDANTVTHILGIRAFSSQLLCEQVVGRGLRRRNYLVGPDGHFEPEYANIYGIPFAFIPSDKPMKDIKPLSPAVEVRSVKGREHLRIVFPKLDGYRIEIPDAAIPFDTTGAPDFVIAKGTVPTWSESAGIVGMPELVEARDPRTYRTREVAFVLARKLLQERFEVSGENRRPWLFPQLVRIAAQWIDECVKVSDGLTIGYLLTSAEKLAEASEHINDAIAEQHANRRSRLRPMLRHFDPVGSTADVSFLTRKAVVSTTKSEISHVTLDGQRGNTWEQILAGECELHPKIAAFAKNDHLGFSIPYVHKGRSHSYVPDFLVRLVRAPGEDFDRTLIVEVSGSRKSPGPTKQKARTARQSWCPAVNNHRGFGRWGYIEITDPVTTKHVLAEAIQYLYDDTAIIGDPELMDFNEVQHGA
ncbi:BPTD_3080 family restriction endonuclease [Mycobacterium marseillense]|uniref:BPTD_3080 family restriction endonuclease n=1 Tax=Mycobacterium marseillense TaxID=701042 RepID=UPI0009F69D3D|nr:DEAD/DEAH box helicase family protein [Mycobacterium marseillense]MCV7407955.1 DEAD/DEAH box helicase family protein [Mycobacterium marseillense]ORA93859.1 restriction endonuclease [Mycobacterium marseillense]